jgi:hypothetical protein
LHWLHATRALTKLLRRLLATPLLPLRRLLRRLPLLLAMQRQLLRRLLALRAMQLLLWRRLLRQRRLLRLRAQASKPQHQLKEKPALGPVFLCLCEPDTGAQSGSRHFPLS